MPSRSRGSSGSARRSSLSISLTIDTTAHRRKVLDCTVLSESRASNLSKSLRQSLIGCPARFSCPLDQRNSENEGVPERLFTIVKMKLHKTRTSRSQMRFLRPGSGRKASCFSKRSQRQYSPGHHRMRDRKTQIWAIGRPGRSGPLPVVTALLGSPLPGEISGLARP